MHPFFREGVNEEFSDLDKESLRYMHDERMLVFSDSEQSRTILAGILGINDNKSVVQKAFSVAQTNSVVPLANYVYACRK